MGLQGVGYKVDITFVIDATGSMGPIIDQVKEQALTLDGKITTALAAANKPVDQLRLRVVDYGDFATECDEAIHQTDFLTMPEGRSVFENAVRNIQYEMRGGDDPENALEALFVAMNSDWVPISAREKGRHIIVLMTDALPLHLGDRVGSVGYDASDYPANVEELQNIWKQSNAQEATTKLSPANKRLVLFVPDGTDEAGHTWEKVKSWEKTTSVKVTADGLAGVPLDFIIEEIVRSM